MASINKKTIIKKTEEFVKEKLSGDGTGHDWWHIKRVVGNAKQIAKIEGGDLFIIELAALLHDIADWKFNNGDSTKGARISRKWLKDLSIGRSIYNEVGFIVEHLSFKGGTNAIKMRSIEGKIVQDADRLDALGAIGIARTFAYGGSMNREIYNPNIKPSTFNSLEAYASSMSKNHTINHFYEKLLLLKTQMNTKTGKKLAQNRHKYMENFLDRFYAEWDGKL